MRRFLAVASIASLLVVSSCATAQHLAGGPVAPPSSSGDLSGSPSPPASPSSPGLSPSGGQLPAGFGKGPPGSGLHRFYAQQVSWSDCGGGDQCASIWVPLNYAKPNGLAITIKAKRQPAANQSNVQGSLFINPGGPGASGINYLSYVGLSSSVTDVYNVIGFDPRGVGESTPVQCVSDHQLDVYLASDPTPDDAAEVQGMERLWHQFTAGCVADSGPLLGHVSTIEAARDMDILRAVVHDPTFNYFGASYGTYLGATYAALFPTHVRRMVLDGAVDPLATAHTTEIDQAAGFQQALTDYLTYCVGQGGCPLGSSVPAAQQRLIALFHQLDAHPLTASDGRKLTEGLAFLGVIVPLYNRAYWSVETSALAAVVGGNADLLLQLSDAYTGRTPSGTYPGNTIEAQAAVNCLDHPEHESIAQIEAGKSAFLKASPVFGPAAMWWPYSCSNWPVASHLPTPNYHAPGAPPIVVIGTTHDPATPYQQAINLANDLDSGVLLTRKGEGHTAYDSGNTCIVSAVDTYLTSGRPPAPGTTC